MRGLLVATLTFCLVIMVIGISLYLFVIKKPANLPKETPMLQQPLQGKSVAMVIAFRDFRDEEYFVPRDVLREAGAGIVTVSTSLGTAVGADGGETEVNLLLTDLKAENFDGIIFVGGPGAAAFMEDEEALRVAREAHEKDKVLAAICIAPTILAKAGVLEGVRATVWSGPLDKSPIKILQDGGALYQDKPVVVDGKIATANGPAAAKKFAETLIEVLRP